MIKNFSQYLVEEEKEVYFTFGRMNPPTIGHGKVMDTLSRKAKNADYKVYVSQVSNPKKDPLSYSDKVKHIRKMFPKHARSVMIDKNVRNVFDVASRLYDQGYKRVTMIVGQDRVREFDVLLNKYNGKKARHGFYNFESIRVVSAGKRDPDAEGVEGMSASKQRANASKNDYQSFSQGVPSTMSDKDARKLFNDVRRGMGLKEERSFKNHIDLGVKNNTREAYVKGDLFEIGDSVVIKESSEVGIVTMLGSNYVIVEMSDGKKLRKWLDAVESIEEKIKTPQDKDIDDKKGTQPARYHKGLKKSTKDKRDSHFKKNSKKADDDESAYKPAPGDKGSETKPSKYTKSFKQMFGERVKDGKVDPLSKMGKSKLTGREISQYYKSNPKARQAARDPQVKKAIELALDLSGNMTYAEKEIEKLKRGLSKHPQVRFALRHANESVNAVAQAKSAIDREKQRDAEKHDSMLDRARLVQARAKNRLK